MPTKLESDLIEKGLNVYATLDEPGTAVTDWICPVQGCKYRSSTSPGAVRAHMDNAKDELHKIYPRKLTTADVQFMYGLPKATKQ